VDNARELSESAEYGETEAAVCRDIMSVLLDTSALMRFVPIRLAYMYSNGVAMFVDALLRVAARAYRVVRVYRDYYAAALM